MPYVKIGTSKSGARTVQVAAKHHGRTKILKHVGSAHDAAELERLKALARRIIHHPSTQRDLFTVPIPPTRVRVTGHRPAAFERVVFHAYASLGFEALGTDLLRDLVLARIWHPASKLQSLRLLAAQFGRGYTKDQAYRLLIRLGTAPPTEAVPTGRDVKQTPTPKERLLTQLHAAHSTHFGGDLSVVLYDVTTLAFETAREGDEYKVPGYSKDGKHKDPQILVGLLTNLQGFPLGYETFAGNTFEGHTLLTALTNWQRQFPTTNLRVIADAGMLSQLTVTTLVAHGFDFIVGARLKSLPAALTSQLVAMAKEDGATATFPSGGHRLIVQYRAQRARKDQHTIDRAVAKAAAIIAGTQSLQRRTKFVLSTEPSTKAKQLNQVAVDQDRALAGLKGYLTNLADVPADTIIAQYHELWHVERSFRMSKHDLRARPVFHYKQDRIHAHLLIVVMALAVAKFLEHTTGQTIRNIVEQLGHALSYSLEDTVTGETWTQHPDLAALDLPTGLAHIVGSA